MFFPPCLSLIVSSSFVSYVCLVLKLFIAILILPENLYLGWGRSLLSKRIALSR